jgi:THO complex subunit 4
MTSLDQSLDDIISAKPRNRGIRKGRRGLRVNKALANAAPRQTTNKTSASNGKAAAAPAVDATSVFDQGSKIIVSNLPHDVTEQQIKVLHRSIPNLHSRT